MQQTLYHILLRISALTLSLVLLFVSGIFSPVTQQLSSNTGTYLATAIGMHAEVAQTEINTLSAQLQERDVALTQREIAVNLKEAKAQPERTTFLLSVALFIVLVLIVLNYVLDFLRSRNIGRVNSGYEKAA